tara:strand:- start:20262 stop:20573 length:312 start_codon:yes stop_codon:yes gene_type:complete
MKCPTCGEPVGAGRYYVAIPEGAYELQMYCDSKCAGVTLVIEYKITDDSEPDCGRRGVLWRVEGETPWRTDGPSHCLPSRLWNEFNKLLSDHHRIVEPTFKEV